MVKCRPLRLLLFVVAVAVVVLVVVDDDDDDDNVVTDDNDIPLVSTFMVLVVVRGTRNRSNLSVREKGVARKNRNGEHGCMILVLVILTNRIMMDIPPVVGVSVRIR